MKYAATIGVYDGVHIGHVEILKRLQKIAQNFGFVSKVFSILYPMDYYSQDFPGLLIPPTERMEILQEFAEEVEFLDLVEISHLTPEEFFKFLIKDNVGAIVVGHDFRFGKRAEGDVDLLRALGSMNSVHVDVVEDVTIDGIRISSTLIRNLLSHGDVKRVKELLGRPYTITGKVYRDLGLGRKLGFPTANVDRGCERLAIPKFGVYISRVDIDGEKFYGVTNIGVRPTIGGEDVVKYETHILDFNRDIYGKRIKVEILEFLRSEVKFSNLEELKKAINDDVRNAKELIGKWGKSSI